ncbi:unnamed protein product [Durusdinium trenchii]|uniref:Uncharacterized protein n=1 Tax=Durusdinium trenchii TaxID=1381693 RepID=A0ABP0SP53_9DINO
MLACRATRSWPQHILQALEQEVGSLAVTPHASRLASLLGDVQMEVRLVACSVLPKLPESAFAEFGLLLVQILKDRGVSAALRSAACKAMSEILSKWTSEAVACRSALLAELLDIEELEEAACTTMAKLPQNLLVTHLQRLSVSVLRLSSEVAEEFVDIVSFTQVQDTEVQRAAISIVDRWSHSGWVKALSHQQDLVRAAACRVIVQMPGFVLVHHEKLLTGLLQDWNSSVRASACFALGHLPAALLPAQVVSLLDDLQYEVRQEACLAAAKLPQGALAPCALAVHAPNLAQLMQDDDANLMMAACTTMARLPGHVMARYATQISNALQGFPSLAQEFHGISGWLLHDQLAVQEAACCIMTMWPSEMVAPHIASVVGLLEVLPHIASVLLAKLPVDLLVPHHVKSLSMKLLHIGSDAAERFVGIPGLLDHQNPEVLSAACSIMGLWRPPVLGQHCPKLAKLLQDPSPSVWQAACITLAKFHQQNSDSEVLEAFTSCGGWAGKAMLACRATRSWPRHILQALQQEVHSVAPQHANQLLTHLARCLLKSSETLDLLARLLETASGCSRPLNRNELLHAAAMAGNREVCEILVNNGRPICVKDQFGQTPEERATMTGHHTLASWFRQHYRLGSTRGGSGAAYHEAMQDERAVVKVEWHQIKLNGAPRMLGLIHSLLAITVREDQSQSSRTYVLEKAASQREDAGEEYQNGIYISCWSEVTSMITLLFGLIFFFCWEVFVKNSERFAFSFAHAHRAFLVSDPERLSSTAMVSQWCAGGDGVPSCLCW